MFVFMHLMTYSLTYSLEYNSWVEVKYLLTCEDYNKLLTNLYNRLVSRGQLLWTRWTTSSTKQKSNLTSMSSITPGPGSTFALFPFSVMKAMMFITKNMKRSKTEATTRRSASNFLWYAIFPVQTVFQKIYTLFYKCHPISMINWCPSGITHTDV